MDENLVVPHVTGVKHRMKYIKEDFASIHATLTAKHMSRSALCKKVERFAEEIESKEGRQSVPVLIDVEPHLQAISSAAKRKATSTLLETERRPEWTKYPKHFQKFDYATSSVEDPETDLLTVVQTGQITNDNQARIARLACNILNKALLTYRDPDFQDPLSDQLEAFQPGPAPQPDIEYGGDVPPYDQNAF